MFNLEKSDFQRRLVVMAAALLFSASCIGTAVSPARAAPTADASSAVSANV